MKVVVFHWRPKPPTYATPLMILHNVKLGNLVNPFMRVTN